MKQKLEMLFPFLDKRNVNAVIVTALKTTYTTNSPIQTFHPTPIHTPNHTIPYTPPSLLFPPILQCSYFVITINNTSIIINTTITVQLILSFAFRATVPRFLRALCSVLACRSTCLSTSSSICTCSSNSSPICMLSSRCRPILPANRSKASSCCARTCEW